MDSLNLNPIELASLEQAFLLYSNNTATIPTHEFARIIASLNIATHPDEIHFIIKAVDVNGDNRIDFHEFVSAIVNYLPTSPPELCCVPVEMETANWAADIDGQNEKSASFHGDEELLQCFRAFDKNNDNRISLSELEETLEILGGNLTPREIKAMMEEADINGDGYIDFHEFKQLVPF